jgi:cyclophilin family peptidyl-prolyl cis-trans isomerase
MWKYISMWKIRYAILAGIASVGAACSSRSPLRVPTPKELALVGPDSFQVAFETTRGSFLVTAHRDWSPLGVDRFYRLVKLGYYDGTRFFRVVPGFVVQWGIHGDPAVSAVWLNRRVPDEPVRQGNTRSRVAFARGGPNTRSVQLYVNLADNVRLDTTSTFGFPAIGEVVEGMALVDSMYDGYSCRRGAVGTCPSQDSLRLRGDAYVRRVHPLLDQIKRALVIREWRQRR